MIRGAAICGCALPQTEFFAAFIASEISIFISDFGFSEYTLEEFLLSMRLNAKGGLKYPSGNDVGYVPFTGQSINVDYISKILGNYKSLRDYLDRKFENTIDGY